MKRLLAMLAAASLAGGCHYYFEDDDPPDIRPDGGIDPDTDGGLSAACTSPVPDPLPPLPVVPVDGADRPLFASWENIDPVAAGDFYCNEQNGIACGPAAGNTDTCHVINFETGDGYCTFVDVDIFCDGEGQVISWDDGRCWLCGPVASRAALCAQDVDGVDCRTWPYPSNGTAGEPCALHEDCGTGLVCGQSAGSGYGTCMCPEDVGTLPSPPQDCFTGLF